MKYHLALGRKIDLDGIERDAKLGKCPRHVMQTVRDRLNAAVHAPDGEAISSLDKLRSKISSKPEHWAAARKLSEQVSSGDVIYCTGEDIGIPVAVLCGAKPDRPKIVVYFHNIDRLRGRVALKLFGLADKIDVFMVNSRPQTEFVRSYLNIPESRILVLLEQTDTKFFTPGPVSADKKRQIVVSVGLEKRDYRVLAAATADLDVDVKISGFSKDAKALSQAFPDTMPENMSRKFYEWPDLVQLYRDADVVAVCLVDNKYAAGGQGLLEAMACKRPVAITRTQGLVDYYLTPDTAKVVGVADAAALREAIVHLLKNPQEAEARAQRGYEMVVNHHNSEHYVDVLVEKLRSL
ncbi:glycosyltransferase family 4 protein [Tychonema sp. LEGE 07203]|uniref:glycosyltransferase family 4 protein n=1 Tax=Tychonema sp. LEGE 07203 TaxID=1828671 RepID=UPI00187EFDBB|nr:glycosyltransferase family 4 protein [Tychonema sp. LEGE 07203]MBE9096180.1 glycosyltransferase family 4 protein [Tychonema sp. LEGE 07203]